MMAQRNIRNPFETDAFVGWRAERMGDPVAKLSFLRQKMDHSSVNARRPLWMRSVVGAASALVLILFIPAHGVVSDVSSVVARNHPFPARHEAGRPQSFRDVWLVDEQPGIDTYSNGLRIDNTYRVPGQKRFYQVLHRENGFQPLEEWRSEPVGLVFHTTESNQATFAADNNHKLKRIAGGLLEEVRGRQSYNFVIDRFGRVFRVVDEGSAANHAGNSVWADQNFGYVNLNNSFLGIAFEAQSGGPRLTEGQVHAARTLTDMLRAKYKILATNCVTHAQVSVNPSNMLIGYHTDWARDFPFEEIGLGDNYSIPLPAIADFGFGYDGLFQKAMGGEPWDGILHAEQELAAAALKNPSTLRAYRASMHDRYKKLYASLKLTGALDESSGLKSATD